MGRSGGTGTGAPELRDSRRLTGPNLISPGAAAVIDARTGDVSAAELIAAWEHQVGRILPAVGWGAHRTWSRSYPDGVSLAFDAPIDALYAATEVNEWAFAAAVASLTGGPRPRLDDAVEELSEQIERERNPALLAMAAAAADRGVCFLWDDEHTSVGMGTGSIVWPTDGIPPPERVAWDEVSDIPVTLVTGSNGKTTTVRLLAAIAAAWGKVAGYSCTDGIVIAGEMVDAGDWSGPGGARAVLRDRRVEMAILETARGGLLRRGLALDRADAAIVTNVAADHLGEWGVHDVAAIAEAKLVVRRAVDGGALIVNADDPVLAEAAARLERQVTWLRWDAPEPPDGPNALWTVQDGSLVRLQTADGHLDGDAVTRIEDIPITLGGAARYNVYNALAAAAAAHAMGIPDEAIRVGLMSFGGSASENPGRGNLFDLNGVTVFVDFAHNPHGVRAIADWAREWSSGRTLAMVGQAGDRDDDSVRELAAATLEMDPALVMVKEMREYARGRPDGEVTSILLEALRGRDYPAEQIHRADSELAAVRKLLELAEPGDLLVLPVQAKRQAVLDLMERLSDEGWKAGSPVPDVDGG